MVTYAEDHELTAEAKSAFLQNISAGLTQTVIQEALFFKQTAFLAIVRAVCLAASVARYKPTLDRS
jgi:hypothetical protein